VTNLAPEAGPAHHAPAPAHVRFLLAVARALGRVVGFAAALMPLRSTRVTRINIALCFPELGSRARQRLIRDSLIHTATFAFELPLVFGARAAHVRQLVVGVDGESWLTGALASGQGLLLLVPHIGNWELFSQYLGPHNVTALYKPPRRSWLDVRLRARRGRRGARMFPADRQGVRAVLETLRTGGLVALLPDQVPEPAAGISAEFFGRPALTMVLPARLAGATGCQVALGTAIRCRGGFRLEIAPLPALQQAADVASATIALNQAIEHCVRRYPAQYQWEYKRFKRISADAVDPYRGT